MMIKTNIWDPLRWQNHSETPKFWKFSRTVFLFLDNFTPYYPRIKKTKIILNQLYVFYNVCLYIRAEKQLSRALTQKIFFLVIRRSSKLWIINLFLKSQFQKLIKMDLYNILNQKLCSEKFASFWNFDLKVSI